MKVWVEDKRRMRAPTCQMQPQTQLIRTNYGPQPTVNRRRLPTKKRTQPLMCVNQKAHSQLVPWATDIHTRGIHFLPNRAEIALVVLCFNCGLRLIWPKGKCSNNGRDRHKKQRSSQKHAGTPTHQATHTHTQQTHSCWKQSYVRVSGRGHFYLQVGDGRSEIICYLHICQK